MTWHPFLGDSHNRSSTTAELTTIADNENDHRMILKELQARLPSHLKIHRIGLSATGLVNRSSDVDLIIELEGNGH